MIIITADLTGAADTIDELLAMAREHVHRSRGEPGCLEHRVARDVDDPLRLVFFERWADLDAVRTHFAVPASGEFVRRAARLAGHAPRIELYAAEPTAP